MNPNRKMRPARWFVLAAALLTSVAVPHAQPAPPLVIGFTAPLSGPDTAYGTGLRHGAQLAVARANAAGGIGGRPLDLMVLDDGGDPQRAAANARQLLQGGAVAITGVHGARSTLAVAGVLAAPGAEASLALVAPATGAEALRDPPLPGVFHLRAGSAEEASAAMLHLDTLGLSRFAIVAQRDALGDSGHERMMVELTRIAIRPEIVERVPANAAAGDVQRAMQKVCGAKPEAVVVVLDARLAAAAVTEARARNCAGQYLVFSETGAALAFREPTAEGPHPLAGLLVTQVVPHPSNSLHPLVSEYQRALAAHKAGSGSYPSVEAYLAVRVIQEALRGCGREGARACVLQALATRSFDLPGLRVQFGSDQRQPRPFVEITLLDARGRFRR